jgi:hypothetical protein
MRARAVSIAFSSRGEKSKQKKAFRDIIKKGWLLIYRKDLGVLKGKTVWN